MSRRGIREHIFKLLFQSEFHDRDEMDAQVDCYFENFMKPEIPELLKAVEEDDKEMASGNFTELDEAADAISKAKTAYEEELQIAEKSLSEVREKLNRILDHVEELDKAISEKIVGWTIDRIGKVELTILRLALYEIKYDEQVPESVAINEAVELAKKYGQEDAFSFVNGILAKFAKDTKDSVTNA